MREQVEMRRAVIERIRIRAGSQVRMARSSNRALRVACPKAGAGVVICGTDVSDISPDVEVDVDDSF
jgi:hypothetical protein